jgi:hypothetical protein
MYRVNWSEIFHGYKFISIGLIVDHDTHESVSPDGILINNVTKDIIPIEIKCIRRPKNIYSQNSLRELKLAHSQLKTFKDIIKDAYGITKGIIAFIYIYEQDGLHVEFEYAVVGLVD